MACWQTRITDVNDNIYIESGSRSNSYYGKFWVAKITGLSEKFGFERIFINDKDGALITSDGIYQIFRTCTWAKRPDEYFLKVNDGKYKIITKVEAFTILTQEKLI